MPIFMVLAPKKKTTWLTSHAAFPYKFLLEEHMYWHLYIPKKKMLGPWDIGWRFSPVRSQPGTQSASLLGVTRDWDGQQPANKHWQRPQKKHEMNPVVFSPRSSLAVTSHHSCPNLSHSERLSEGLIFLRQIYLSEQVIDFARRCRFFVVLTLLAATFPHE